MFSALKQTPKSMPTYSMYYTGGGVGGITESVFFPLAINVTIIGMAM